MNTKTKALIESAIMIALSTVLSLVKVWEMPLGGSITLVSMLPVMLVSVRNTRYIEGILFSGKAQTPCIG